MISKELKDWKYYWDKFPLYFKNSNGIIEHFQILFDLLVQNDGLYDELFEFLDLFNPNSPKNMDILKKIGALYGVPSPSLSLNFTLTINNDEITQTNTPTIIELNEMEYLILILSQIVRNNFDGSFEQSNEFYNIINKYSETRLNIKQGINTFGQFETVAYLNEIPINSRINYYYMLYAGLLTLESAGIKYTYKVENVSNYLYYNDENWNGGYWY